MAKKKKGKVAIVIALKPMGGKNPKKPENTANAVGVKKSKPASCKDCGKPLDKGVCKMGCGFCDECGKPLDKGMCKMGCA